MNKKQLITISLSALFAASAMGAEIPAIPSDIVWDGTTNVKIESGTQKADVCGGKIYTVLGKTDGSGPKFQSGGLLGIGATNYKFRGASLQMNKDDAHVYIYGGKYYDKVSAVDNMTTNPGIAYGSTVNASTGHMYVYGGTFNSDITGLGMAQSGVHTANTDIHILGSISNGVGMGVFGGVSGASGGSASLVGNTSVTVSGSGNTSFIAGGNRMAANLIGNVTLSVENGGTVGGILGGNYFHNTSTSTSTISGDISITINNGIVSKQNFAVSGIVGGGMNTNVSKSTNISIQGTSAIDGGIAGGSAGWGTVNVATTNISINGESVNFSGTQSISEPNDKEWWENIGSTLKNVTVNNAIVGGSIAAGVLANADYTVTTSNIIISGGELTGSGNHIYGGGIAQGTSSYTATSHVGTANITIDASENTVSFDGNIYGGGRADDYGTATVGDVNIVFKGDGSNLTFTGTVDGNGHVNGSKSAYASVSGTQTFTFDSYNGTFSGTIQNFDTLNVVNSKLTGTVKVGNDITAEKIHISGDSSVGKFVNASGDTLTFGAEIEEGGNLEIDSGAIGSENSSVSSVTLTTNASVTVKASESSVTLTSSAEGVVVNKAEEIATSNVEISVEGIVVEEVLAAWSFDISNNNEDVTVTMDVGEGVDVNTIKIFHRENETSAWEDYTEVVKDIKLENGKLTFTTTSFSDYTAAVAAPEPSAFGLLAGLGAIVLAVSRRRRNCR